MTMKMFSWIENSGHFGYKLCDLTTEMSFSLMSVAALAFVCVFLTRTYGRSAFTASLIFTTCVCVLIKSVIYEVEVLSTGILH